MSQSVAPLSGLGDLNHDGIIDSTDVTLVGNAISGNYTTIYPGDPAECIRRANVAGNLLGYLNILDWGIVSIYKTGNIFIFPVDAPSIFNVGDFVVMRDVGSSVATWKIVAMDPLSVNGSSYDIGSYTTQVVVPDAQYPTIGQVLTVTFKQMAGHWYKVPNPYPIVYEGATGRVEYNITTAQAGINLDIQVSLAETDQAPYIPRDVFTFPKVSLTSNGGTQRLYGMVEPVRSGIFQIFVSQYKTINGVYTRISRKQCGSLTVGEPSNDQSGILLKSGYWYVDTNNPNMSGYAFEYRFQHRMVENGTYIPYITVQTEMVYDSPTATLVPGIGRFILPIDGLHPRPLLASQSGQYMDESITLYPTDRIWPDFLKYVPSGIMKPLSAFMAYKSTSKTGVSRTVPIYPILITNIAGVMS